MSELTKKYLGEVAVEALVTNIKAEDAKVLDAAKKYADGLAPNYDAAGTAQSKANEALEAAKAYTDTLENGQVKLNKEAIATLNGEGEGSVKKAVADAQATLQGNIEAVDAKADANAEAITAINHAETGILKQAKDHTDTEVAKVQGEVDALETYVGTFTHDTAKTVVEYINAKTDGIATSGNLEALGARVTAVEGDVTTIKGDYLKGADKTELEGKITAAQGAADKAQGDIDTLAGTYATDKAALEGAIALKADQTALDEVAGVANAAVAKSVYDEKVAALEAEDTRIAGLVTAEAERAAGVEADHEERLVKVETFFETAEDETIDKAMDTLVEIQKYITEDGAAADEMVKDIAANEKAIADHIATDHDFAGADATLKAELEGKINAKADSSVVEGIDGRLTTAEGKITTVEGKVSTLEGQVSTLEGKMTTVEGAVATKVEQEAYNTKIAALEGVDADLDERLQLVEAQLGDGENSVSDLIAAAEQRAKEAAAEDATTKANKALEDAKKYADEEDAKIETRVDALEQASATHALASDLTALGNRVTVEEGKVATLQGEMDAVEALAAANKAAHEANTAAIALKAAQADLDALAGRVTTAEGAISDNADAIEALTTKHNEDKVTIDAAIAANTSAINSFVAIDAETINAMFA